MKLNTSFSSKKAYHAEHWWLTPIILATQQTDLRISVQATLRQIVLETLSQKNTQH
jgi:hypothetical protein